MLGIIVVEYAVVGMHIFGGKIIKGDAALAKIDFGKSNYYSNNFNDFASSLVTLFELLIVNNVSTVLKLYRMETYMPMLTWNVSSINLSLVVCDDGRRSRRHEQVVSIVLCKLLHHRSRHGLEPCGRVHRGGVFRPSRNRAQRQTKSCCRGSPRPLFAAFFASIW